MKTTLLMALSALMMVLPVGVMADEHAGDKPAIPIKHPYAFATSPVQANGAVFFTAMGTGAADRLVEARSDVSERIELHTHEMDGDMMKMREVDGYDLLADGDVLTLEPMGHHIMLMGLKGQLEEGSSFPMVLRFEQAGELNIDVAVIKPGTKPEAAAE